MPEPAVDADAFNAFEAAAWERQVAGYERFFGPITTRLVGPLLDAAQVGPSTRVLDAACGPGYGARTRGRTRRVGHWARRRGRDDRARATASSGA